MDLQFRRQSAKKNKKKSCNKMMTGKFIAVIALLCLSVFSVCVYTPLSEINALKDLFNTTNGAYWRDNTNWMLGDPCQNKWYGVACVEDQGLLEFFLFLQSKRNCHLIKQINHQVFITLMEFSFQETILTMLTLMIFQTPLGPFNTLQALILATIPSVAPFQLASVT